MGARDIQRAGRVRVSPLLLSCRTTRLVDWRRVVRIVFVLLGLAVAGILVVWGMSGWVVHVTRAQVYHSIEDLPYRDVGVVLGTSRRTRDGRENLYFRYRINAVVELYQQGKIRHILVSGDNKTADYDEPNDMRHALIQSGIPKSAITRDYAGFRTLDSIVRARDVFGLNGFTVISQEYHNYRALFIARHEGLDAVAYCARDVEAPEFRLRNVAREVVARAMSVVDLYILRTRPRFPGPPEPIQLEAKEG
ncbi:MAG TPA: ElyC/SanA/YdcF family protein [Candidatus Sumerlaeota bacterium]|nr:ElyC/SanA/YdcF family protein [Candidatus Sumerlaeota bacterium]